MAFIDLIGSAIGAVTALMELVVTALFSTTSRLVRNPPPGESRFSGKNIAIAVAPLASIVVLIAAVFWFADWSHEREVRRVEKSQAAADMLVRKLANKFDKDPQQGAPVVGPAQVDDAWGNAFVVSFERGIIGNTFRVTSRGEDGKLGTVDDVQSAETRLFTKKEIAINAAKKLIEKIDDDDKNGR